MKAGIVKGLFALVCLVPAVAVAEAEDASSSVVVVEKAADVPKRLQFAAKRFLKKHCTESQKLRLTIGQFFDHGHSTSTNQMEPYAKILVPLDTDGKPHGEEVHREPRSHSPTRIVPYEHGVKHDMEKLFRRSLEGKLYLEKEIPWKDGKMAGAIRTRYSDGAVRSETQVVDGVPTGVSKTYDRQGSLLRSMTLKAGKPHGVRKDFFSGTKQPRRVIPYEQGKVNGTAREYYANGQLKREAPFHMDVRHGMEKRFEADGTPAGVRYWLDGEEVFKKEYEAAQQD